MTDNFKRFTHVFKNGKKVTVIWDLSGRKPRVERTDDSAELDESMFGEYNIWLESVVMPEILASVTPDQLESLCKIGIAQYEHSKI